METLITTTLILALLSTAIGWYYLKRGKTQKLISLVLGLMICFLLTLSLSQRGELRGACPLSDAGEIFLFTAWSLSIFYVLTGGAYRLSLLGLFTSPTIGILLGFVLIPGMLTETPVRAETLDPWKESHAATSVLAFGALGLAALSSVMFLLLDKRLKAQQSDFFSVKMPPVKSLITSVHRLLLVGVVVLTLGIIAGFISHNDSGLQHLLIAGGVWMAYLVLILWYNWQGLPPRRLSWITTGLFLLSCLAFFII